MAKRGDLKPMDEFEEVIRKNAVGYHVVGFRPGKSSKLYQKFATLQDAREYASNSMNQSLGLRCMMIYAIDEYDHHALVETIDQYDLQFKKVEPKRY